MARNQSPEWQVLRRDKPTFIASATVYLATLCIFLQLAGLAGAIYGPPPFLHPLFWILGIPLTVWALALGDYGPRSVAVFRVLMIADGPVALALLAAAYVARADILPPYIITAVAAVVLCMVGCWFYRRSALRRQGPFRG